MWPHTLQLTEDMTDNSQQYLSCALLSKYITIWYLTNQMKCLNSLLMFKNMNTSKLEAPLWYSGTNGKKSIFQMSTYTFSDLGIISIKTKILE